MNAVKKIITHKNLTWSKKLEFRDHLMKMGHKNVIGGSNDNTILSFESTTQARAFMIDFYNAVKRIPGIFISIDKDLNADIRIKTKWDTYKPLNTNFKLFK
jgi:hypothetical protein